MFLEHKIRHVAKFGFPHAGGDVSLPRSLITSSVWFSPRRWGCFTGISLDLPGIESFPHAGGDVSEALSSPVGGYVFSPRRWGCFRDEVVPVENRKVFPTQVGMFP